MWHWPILVLCPKVILLPSQVLLVISLALGVVSWYLIENRTRFLPTATFVGTAVTLLIGCIASVSLPWLIVRPVLTYQIPENSLKINIQPPYVGKFQQYTGDYRTGLTIGPPAPHGRHSTLLLGDSHAVMYFPAILDICLQEGCVLTSFAADGGTWPFFVAEGALPANYYHSEASPDGWTPERRLAFDDARRNFIRSTSPSVIFVCGRWSHYYSELGPKSFERHMIDLLDELPATSVVVIPGQPPTLPFGSSGLSSGKLEIPPYRAFSEDPMEREKRQSAHSVIEKIARQDSRIRFVPVDAEFLGSQGIKFLQDGLILYRDDDHLNISGAKKCKARLQSAMVTAE